METGYLLINKPSGPTSHDVIDALREITGERRIGHVGTLDPFAEGLLLVGLGLDATRNLGKEELTRTMIGNFELSEAVPLDSLTAENWRERLVAFNTVMATGTFEILHEGHKRYLYEAKRLGKRLVVVVARQARAEALRGRRLRASEEERLARVASLPFVDTILLGDEHDPYESVKKIKPDIIALGYDQRIFVRELPEKIKAFGLSTKIARIPAHEAGKFKSSLL